MAAAMRWLNALTRLGEPSLPPKRASWRGVRARRCAASEPFGERSRRECVKQVEPCWAVPLLRSWLPRAFDAPGRAPLGPLRGSAETVVPGHRGLVLLVAPAALGARRAGCRFRGHRRD